jgi:carboxymethylenebutenolidase
MLEIILLAAAVSSADIGGGHAIDTKPLTTLSETAAEQLGVPSLSPAVEPASRVATDHAAPVENPDLIAATGLVAADAAEGTPSAMGLQFARANEHYTSMDRKVRIEVLRPDNDERRPAILILHGASGMGDGTFYRGAAEMFAERGYVTFIPHYLEPAVAQPGTKGPKTAKAQKAQAAGKDPKPDGNVRAGFAAQDQILRDALEFISTYRYVDPSRMGVFGMSLGGFHALNLSSRDYRISAVVDMSGALRGNNMPESNRLAPTLALHGAKDSIVPVSRAKSLAAYLQARGIPHELTIYPDQGHFFRGRAQHDAFKRSVIFFNTYLRPPDAHRAAQSGDDAETPQP